LSWENGIYLGAVPLTTSQILTVLVYFRRILRAINYLLTMIMVSFSFKKLLYDIIFGAMVFYITTQLISGIQTPILISHWIMIIAIFGLSNNLVGQTIKFFTISSNLFSKIFVGTILNFAAIYGMTIIVPGIVISDTYIDTVSIGILSINPFTLSSTFTIIAAAFITSTIYAIIDWLQYD